MPPPRHNGLGILDNGDWKDAKEAWAASPDWKKPGWKPVAQPAAKHYLHRLWCLVWPKPKPAEKLRRTAWLDGLRGFAALVVYCHHHELWAHEFVVDWDVLQNGFGYKGYHAFATAPFARNFFTGGHYAVATFFVISGYVLSTKPLSLLHSGELTKFGDNIASALFRRWLRLYIPVISTTFIFAISWHLLGSPLWAQSVEPQGNLRDEIWAWYTEFKNFSFVFGSGGKPWFSYNRHTWSIPVEMKGSIIIYTALVAFSRLATRARLGCTAALAFYFLYIADGWYGAAFLAGMLLCDLDLLSAAGALPGALAALEPYKRFVYYHVLVVSLYLGGVPSATQDVNDLRASRGWYYLSFLKPQAVFDYKFFYLFWAAVALVAATPRIRCLKRFFETRFCQHLGRISYALYLVHGPVLQTLGDRLYAATGWHGEVQRTNIPGWVDRVRLPAVGPLGLELSFLLPNLLVLLPLTLWLAELATRAFDESAVRFAAWLYGRMLPSPSPSPSVTKA